MAREREVYLEQSRNDGGEGEGEGDDEDTSGETYLEWLRRTTLEKTKREKTTHSRLQSLSSV